MSKMQRFHVEIALFAGKARTVIPADNDSAKLVCD